uniref:leukocyte-associated immunoglobulin-like receptor 1 n=1 Tax=Urocitellus parryii TaxID=9999 RepID=UPI000E55CD66
AAVCFLPGALPRPSISAEPGSEIPRGRPVTIVCRGPAGAQEFRLEKEGRSLFWDKKNSSPSEREARFLFPSMSEDTAGRYHCLYLKSTLWSELSDDLRLVLSGEDVTQVTTPVPVSLSPHALRSLEPWSHFDFVPLLPRGTEDSNNPGECRHIPHEPRAVPRRSPVHAQQQHRGLCGVLTPVPPPAAPALLLTTEHLYLLIGVPLALLLCLLLLLLFCLHRQHQRKPGPPGGQGQLQRPQERLGLAVDSLERSPDMATADRPPEKDRETGNPAPAARDPQEVTYAQLDHGALTERATRAGSPLTPEPSTYATLARH